MDDNSLSDEITAAFFQEFPHRFEDGCRIVAVAKTPRIIKIAVESSRDVVASLDGLGRLADRLGVRRVDIVPWNGKIHDLISNALKPLTINGLYLYRDMGTALALVDSNIGNADYENLVAASKLCGWDIKAVTGAALHEMKLSAQHSLCSLEGITEKMAQNLIDAGVFTYDDVTVIDPATVAELTGLPSTEVKSIINLAEAAYLRNVKPDQG